MVSGSPGSIAIESMLRISASPSGLIRSQVRPASGERNTPLGVPATIRPGFEGAIARARTPWPAIPASISKVAPPSVLRATPPPEPRTSQKPA